MLIVGVRFKNVGKIYYFDPGHISADLLVQGTSVIVETGRGAEYGVIALEKRDKRPEEIVQPLKRVLRIATPEDDKQEAANRLREDDAKKICEEKIASHGLFMNLVDAELSFDMSKIIFYFTAEGRVDFRELVKDLAAAFRMRIELRQIGVRDEAKMLSGIGICGRELCCALFLDEFQPVSIKSAKDQGLSLNPTKISGICGKLMCCLKYEEATYQELMKGMPQVGDLVRTPGGDGEVISLNILSQTVKVAVHAKNQEETQSDFYPVGELTVLRRSQKCGKS